MHKMGASPECINDELRKAIQENRSPNFASKTAHLFLGTVDSREEVRPKIIYGIRGGDGISVKEEEEVEREKSTTAPKSVLKTV